MAEHNARDRTPWTEWVAAQIRAERAARHMTQEQVIALSGLPRSTYLRLEKGTRVPDADQLKRLCDGYGMKLSLFYSRVEEREAEDSSYEARAEAALNRATPAAQRRGRNLARELREAPEEPAKADHSGDPRISRSASTG
jgi:transcriptional regulator with XRE-family HTH domain